MSGLKRGPREYSIFISHRYDDDEIYTVLRRHLIDGIRIANLSIEVDKQLSTSDAAATKRSISSRIRKADVLLVFAHSAGEMVEHELDRARHYGVPVIAVVDPMRVEEKYRKARSARIKQQAVCEVTLDKPEAIVAAIRSYALPQGRNLPDVADMTQVVTSVRDEVTSPKDIAGRLSEPQRRQGLMRRISSFLFGRPGPSASKDQGL